jgi:NAD(P)-dependent dehydrogenase (short-subunit alcohol dehydrogenase family)
MKNGRLAGKVALITGGARGIGKETGLKMIREGASVVLLDILEDELQKTRKFLSKVGNRVLAIKTDISQEEQVAAAVRNTVNEFGAVDILVNNAGIVCPAPVDEVMEKDWDDVVAVNLKGSFFCTKALLPIMKERNHGRIINIGSRASLGKYARTVYSATKAGLIGMTRTWALELAPFNITVNYIGPGLIATDLFRQVNPRDSERTQRLIKSIPLNRLGTPEDLANTISFLASDEAAYITGQTLFVCGGLSVQSVQW